MDTSVTAPPEVFIFVSHSSRNDADVTAIAEVLTAARRQVWVDHLNGIPVGTRSFDKRIQEKLVGCAQGIFVLSEASAVSDECNSEWRHVLLSNKPLYVVRLEPLPLKAFPPRLLIAQYADLVADNRARGLEALVEALRLGIALRSDHPGTGVAAPAAYSRTGSSICPSSAATANWPV